MQALHLQADLTDLLHEPQEGHDVGHHVRRDQAAHLRNLPKEPSAPQRTLERLEVRDQVLVHVPGQNAGDDLVVAVRVREPHAPPQERQFRGRVTRPHVRVHPEVVAFGPQLVRPVAGPTLLGDDQAAV